jgi:Tfp pilus assembly protein PilF
MKSGDPRTLLKLGMLSMRVKDLRRAESYLVEARSVAPRSVDVLFALSQAQRLQGQTAEAAQTKAAVDELRAEADAAIERRRVFSRAIMAKPDDVAAHVRYGVDLLGQGRLDEAHVVFQRLLSFDPLNEVAILNLASLLTRQGDSDSALKELGKLLELDPDHETANLQAARIESALGRLAPARDHLLRAAGRNPASRDAHDLLVTVLGALGDAEGAMRHDAIRRQLASVESQPASR